MNDYEKSLKAAETELSELMVEKGRIDVRVAKLRETIIALHRLLSSDDDPAEVAQQGTVQLAESGLTESVREVMQELKKTYPNKYHAPTDIRDRLSVKGFSLTQYKNEMAAIHNVLKRLKDLDEVEAGVTVDGKTYYRWKHSVAVTGFWKHLIEQAKAETAETQVRALSNREKAQAAMAKAKKKDYGIERPKKD